MIVVEMDGYIDIDSSLQFSKHFNHRKSIVKKIMILCEIYLELCHPEHLTLNTPNAYVKTQGADTHCKLSMVHYLLSS